MYSIRFIAFAALLGIGLFAGPSPLRAQTGGDVIGREQIVALDAATAFDVVQRLHPEWFRLRNPGNRVVAYVDGVELGGVFSLQDIPAATVASIEYLEGTRIFERVTTTNAQGVDALIFVSTARELFSGPPGDQGAGGIVHALRIVLLSAVGPGSSTSWSRKSRSAGSARSRARAAPGSSWAWA